MRDLNQKYLDFIKQTGYDNDPLMYDPQEEEKLVDKEKVFEKQDLKSEIIPESEELNNEEKAIQDPYKDTRDLLTSTMTENIVPKLINELNRPKNKMSEYLQDRYKNQLLNKGIPSNEEMQYIQKSAESLENRNADTKIYEDLLEKYKKLSEKEKADLIDAQEKDNEIENLNYMMGAAQELNKALSGSNIGKYKDLQSNKVKNLKDRQKIDRNQLEQEYKLQENIRKAKENAEVKPQEWQALANMYTKIREGKQLTSAELNALETLDKSEIKELKDGANVLIGMANALPRPKGISELDKIKKENYKKLDENRNRNFDLKKESKISDRFFNLSKQMKNQDFRYKDAYKESLAFEQVEKLMDLADKGNATVFGSVGTKMARAMGEVGVLTESDVTRYVNSQKLSQKAADVLNKWRTGKPSKATIKELKEIANVLQETHAIKLQPVFDEYANMAYKNLQGFGDVSRYESYDRLSIPIPVKYKRAKIFFDKNKDKLEKEGITNLKQAEDYLTKIGKLK